MTPIRVMPTRHLVRRIAVGMCATGAAAALVGSQGWTHSTPPSLPSGPHPVTAARHHLAPSVPTDFTTAYGEGELMAADPGSGYWTVDGAGSVSAHGGVPNDGSVTGPLARPVVGMAPTPDGGGYWLVASDGGVFTFGDAPYEGSTGGLRLDAPMTALAPTADGKGYWLVASDGGVFTFGDAGYFGSLAGSGTRVLGMTVDPPSVGYTLIEATGDSESLPSLSTDATTYCGRACQRGSTGSTTTTLPPPTTTRPPPTTTGPPPTTTTTSGTTLYPVGTQNSSEPSGLAPPASNAMSGYRESYVNDFSGSSVPSGWDVYSGNPGGDPGAQWGTSHVVVGGGLLQLNTWQDPAYGNEWVTGGLCQCGLAQTYGAYFVRSRVTGPGPTNVELLWPTGSWPPEIDFNETDGTTGGSSATVHFGSSNSQDQRGISIDMTQWHTWGVIWTPTSITYTVDGRVWGTVNVAGEIPGQPMTLDLQQQTWCSSGWACPTSPQSMQIDWVAEYTPN